jgi:methanogenic corrinoid protein MtbC1
MTDVIAECHESAGRVSGALTIQQASSLLTVPVSTLRSWERRYDIPTTCRTVGGHRRYTEPAINELRLMRDEIARGRRAGDAAVSVRLLLQPDEAAGRFIDTFLDAAEAMEQGRIRTALDDAARELGLGAAIDDVVMPAMRRIGRWWETGRCGVGHEHLATEAVRMWLGKIVAFAPQPRRSGPVVLACGPGDAHTLGLEAFAALLAEAGRRCCVLGARTPVTAVVAAVHRVDPAAVLLVSHLSSGRRRAAESVRTVAALGVPTFYAGNAFISASTRHRVPGTYLGDSLHAALRAMETVLAGRAGG